jgi:hypothetical protein
MKSTPGIENNETVEFAQKDKINDLKKDENIYKRK